MTTEDIDHRAFLSSLDDAERRDLNATSNMKSFLHLAIHVIALCTTGTLIALQTPLWWMLLVPHGILLVFLFTLQHETIHRTVFTSVRVNEMIASIIGVLLLNPANWFRYFHLAHHRHTNDPEHDPELQGEKPQSMGQYVAHVSGIPLWYSSIKTIVINAFSAKHENYIPPKGRSRVVQEARLHLAIYIAVFAICAATSSTFLLWVWIVPALLGQPFLRLYLMAEHGRCPPVANMFENTRTTFTNSLVRRIAWNMPYHAEHHAVPTVPFHNLPRLHELVKTHLKSTSKGYHDFHRDNLLDLK